MSGGFAGLSKRREQSGKKLSRVSSQSYQSDGSSNSQRSFDSLRNMTRDNRYFDGHVFGLRRGTKIGVKEKYKELIELLRIKKGKKDKKAKDNHKLEKKFDDRFENLLKHDHRSALVDLNTKMKCSIKELAATSGIEYKDEEYKNEEIGYNSSGTT